MRIAEAFRYGRGLGQSRPRRSEANVWRKQCGGWAHGRGLTVIAVIYVRRAAGEGTDDRRPRATAEPR